MRSLVEQREKPEHCWLIAGQEQQVSPRRTLQTVNWPDTEPVLLCWLVRPLVGRVRAPQRETAPDHRAHHHHLCDEDLDDHHHLCHDNFLK